jgi:hypothetical protein
MVSWKGIVFVGNVDEPAAIHSGGIINTDTLIDDIFSCSFNEN